MTAAVWLPWVPQHVPWLVAGGTAHADLPKRGKGCERQAERIDMAWGERSPLLLIEEAWSLIGPGFKPGNRLRRGRAMVSPRGVCKEREERGGVRRLS